MGGASAPPGKLAAVAGERTKPVLDGTGWRAEASEPGGEAWGVGEATGLNQNEEGAVLRVCDRWEGK